MYINVAYQKDMLESCSTPTDCADETVPLKILCCGFYKITSRDNVVTISRPNGRKDYQLLYFHNGQGHFSLGGQGENETPGSFREVTVQAGQMVLFCPGERQVYEYFASDRTEVYWIHFTGNAVWRLLSDNGFKSGEQVFFSGTSISYQELWQKMIQELQLYRMGCQKLLCLMFQELLLLIWRNRENPFSIRTQAEQEVSFALSYFNECYADPISIEEYAASRYITPAWFIHTFRQQTGFTPLQYIISRRMANARELLCQSYSVSETASMVGYDDPLYFSRLFKRNVGISPKDYQSFKERLSKNRQ